jgi:HD domain
MTSGPGVTSCRPRSAVPEQSKAAAVAARLLRGLEARLNHSAAVAARINVVADLVEPAWRSPLRDAAWLHDVGYSETVAFTGFHPLDGARWLRDHGWPPETCRLVAWHTEPLDEARRHGLHAELTAEFNRPSQRAAAVLAWADLTTSPTGERWDAERRLADILRRYPPGSIVHDATRASLPALREAVRTVEDLLGLAS